MGLNIKNQAVEKLATELASQIRETKTAAIRRALEEMKLRLSLRGGDSKKQERLQEFLKREIWPAFVGQRPVSKEEREQILGFGEKGV